jgi:hypothetical protein
MGFNTSQEHFTRSVMDRANAHYLQKNPHLPSRRFKFPIIQVLRERVPAGIQNVVAKMVPVAVRDWVVGHQVISGLHWEVTPGFAVLTDLHAYIRANVCGREARGWFEPGSADLASYVDWLERCFLSLRNSSDGTPLVKEVVRTDAVYPGPSRHFMPDLIVVWNDMRAVSHATSDLLGSFTAELATGRSGNHRPEGFVIIANDDTALQAVAPPQGIADLASLISRAL